MIKIEGFTDFRNKPTFDFCVAILSFWTIFLMPIGSTYYNNLPGNADHAEIPYSAVAPAKVTDREWELNSVGVTPEESALSV